MYKFTFLRNSHSTHALAWQLFYRCFIAELTAVPAPAQALTITVLLGHSRLRWHQEKWRCSHWCWEQRYTAIPSMGQQNGAPCTARFLPCAENARVSCPAVTPNWRGSVGLPQVCQGSQDFSLQSSLTPTACAFPTQAFPPTAQLEFV